MDLIVHSIRTNEWGEIGYLLHNSSDQVLIFDPGGKAEEFIAYIETNNLTPIAIFNTHGHHDHIGAVDTLRKHYDISFYLDKRDEPILKTANFYIKLFGSNQTITIPTIDIDVDSLGPEHALGSMQIRIINSPGHTPGGVCYRVGTHIMTGDTLFAGDIGRVDLPGGDKEALASSLKRICDLPSEMIIHPGHGKPSSIGHEIKSNAKLMELIK